MKVVPTYNITIEDRRGFPDVIANDLRHASGDFADRCEIEYDEDEDKVTVRAEDSVAAKKLYEWLEGAKQDYKTEFVNAEGEYNAARQLADAVYDAMKVGGSGD